jgi:CspA family cold shock protein
LRETGLATKHSHLSEIERIQALLAMLSWPGPDQSLTRYMEIKHERLGNEYKERPVLADPLMIYRGEYNKLLRSSGATKKQEIIEPLSDFKTGTVKNFCLGTYGDYGFIQADDGGPDVFVHKNHLSKGTINLSEGDRVRFMIVDSPKGPQARNVQLVE